MAKIVVIDAYERPKTDVYQETAIIFVGFYLVSAFNLHFSLLKHLLLKCEGLKPQVAIEIDANSKTRYNTNTIVET